MGFQLGIDVLLQDDKLLTRLKSSRVGLVAHPASVNSVLTHSLDALVSAGVNITCAFGPQHGMRGEKQYNMIESDDYIDPVHKVPVFSLYGKSRKPTKQMLDYCDGVVIDLQDVGCRIYTYLTTMVYVMQECAKLKKWVIVCDRPNPIGRTVEGLSLVKGQESFVGVSPIPMRYGRTLGEMALYYKDYYQLDLDLTVIHMKSYDIENSPWPKELAWVSPSPNIPSVLSAICYPGTVMLEGTTLSEGRGTTRPFEWFGAPNISGIKLKNKMTELVPGLVKHVGVRPVYFEPTYYKYKEQLCEGLQFHVEGSTYSKFFQPYRLMCVAFKAIKLLDPGYELWRDFDYEYEFGRKPIHVICGTDYIQKWIDDPASSYSDLDAACTRDEKSWLQEIEKYKSY